MAKLLDPQTFAKLKGLRLRAQSVVEGFLAGLHRSPHRGFSVEFAEHRKYAPGDDLRRIDWKLFGRTDKLYLKQFEDETNLVCQLVVDASESMAYRGPESPLSKFEYARCLAASLAWLVLKQRDAVGLVTLRGKIENQIRPSGEGAQLAQIIEALESLSPGEKNGARSLSPGIIAPRKQALGGHPLHRCI